MLVVFVHALESRLPGIFCAIGPGIYIGWSIFGRDHSWRIAYYTGGGKRVSTASSCFGSLSLLFSKLIFFLLHFFCPFYHRRTRRFFFSVHFVISSPSYATICCCKTSFSIFYDSTYIPLYQTWNQKRRQLDPVAFSFSLPFFRLRSIVFFVLVFSFFPFLLWRED